MSEAWLSPPNPPETAAPEIGDVLASIRRLIAQEGSGLDTARPARSRETTGRGGSALPAGSEGERIRSVIERELNAIEHCNDRLVLGDGPVAASDRLSQIAAASGWQPPAPEPALTPLSAAAPPSPLHPGAPTRPETTVQEADMMLADINRGERKSAPVQVEEDNAFDLFAVEEMADDDQLAGGNALRNLVRDVIRQELQGEMGERISRNLRRAIRQEVAAAITAGLTPGS